MNYTETLEYIHSVSWKGSRPGLERTVELCNMIGNPQNDLKFIHVAGTNGKGSVCSSVASVLQESGYKTGLYTSPYVRVFNERMKINGENISNEKLAEVTEFVKQFADKMTDKPTEFELITVIAFEFFKREKCDVVVLEVGMGGRLDSTNVIKPPVCSVITGIALDHTAFLGKTVREIAKEKAGIIKRGSPVIYGGDDKDAYDVIREIAKERNSDFYFASPDDLQNIRFDLHGTTFDFEDKKNVFCSLVGLYQSSNIATVMKTLQVIKKCGFDISDDSIKSGLMKVKWPARFEIINEDPLMIYDGAHNPQGLRSCVDSIKTFFGKQKVYLLSGVMADKDVGEMIPIIKEVSDFVFTVTPDNPRSMKSDEYARRLKEYGFGARAFSGIEEGVKEALKTAKRDNVALVALGSLYMYGDVMNAVEKCREDI